jgi:hypothetical protein
MAVKRALRWCATNAPKRSQRRERHPASRHYPLGETGGSQGTQPEEAEQRWWTVSWRWRRRQRQRQAAGGRRSAHQPLTQGFPSAWAQSAPLQRARSELLPRRGLFQLRTMEHHLQQDPKAQTSKPPSQRRRAQSAPLQRARSELLLEQPAADPGQRDRHPGFLSKGTWVALDPRWSRHKTHRATDPSQRDRHPGFL